VAGRCGNQHDRWQRLSFATHGHTGRSTHGRNPTGPDRKGALQGTTAPRDRFLKRNVIPDPINNVSRMLQRRAVLVHRKDYSTLCRSYRRVQKGAHYSKEAYSGVVVRQRALNVCWIFTYYRPNIMRSISGWVDYKSSFVTYVCRFGTLLCPQLKRFRPNLVWRLRTQNVRSSLCIMQIRY
jgi:hypothetical protein